MALRKPIYNNAGTPSEVASGDTVADGSGNVLAALSQAEALFPVIDIGGYHFDGSTHYLNGNPVTGIADGKKGTLYCCLRFANNSSATEYVLTNINTRFIFQRGSSGGVSIVCRNNSSGVQVLNFSAGGTPCANAGTYHVLASWDLATAGSARIYVNDATNPTVTVYDDDTISYNRAQWAVGSDTGGGSKFAGDIYALWFDPTSWLELNTESIRRKFVSAGGIPNNLGDNGELPTGTPPILFLGYKDYTKWPANRGAAQGAFTEHGTPAAVTTPLYGRYTPRDIPDLTRGRAIDNGNLPVFY